MLYAYSIVRATYANRKESSVHVNDADIVVSEHDQKIIDDELENIQMIAIKKPELIYHEDLPLFHDSKRRKPTIRKLVRKFSQKSIDDKKNNLSDAETEGRSTLLSISSIKDDEEEKEIKLKETKKKEKKGFFSNLISGNLISGKKDDVNILLFINIRS